jgi:hypothetical protein
MAIEPAAITSIADMLERGLGGDAASLGDVVRAGLDELRALVLSCDAKARGGVAEIDAGGGAAAGGSVFGGVFGAALGGALGGAASRSRASSGGVEICDADEFLKRDATHFNFCVASAIKTGKSYLVGAIAREMVAAGRIAHVLIFTGGEPVDAVDMFEVGFPARAIQYNAGEVAAFLSVCEKRKAGGHALKPTLVVFDDIVGQGVEKDVSIMALFTRGRHLNVWACVSSQQSNNALTPTFKANSRFILFSQLTGSAMTMLHKDMVLRPEMAPKSFRSWVAENCEDYVFGLYDEHAKSLSLMRA